MKPTIHIHHPHTTTHLPTHELAARRHRATSTLPRKPSRPTHPVPPRGRKTIDTRFNLY